jgi:hypothetical protein
MLQNLKMNYNFQRVFLKKIQIFTIQVGKKKVEFITFKLCDLKGN